MAKSRKKDKSVAQAVVSTAAYSLPAPVRAIVSTRWGARLAVLIVLALLGTGIATVDWTSGRPRLKFDKQRAQEVRQEVREQVESVAHRNHEGGLLESHSGEPKKIGARIFKTGPK
ncbi:MAG TPA: hypothetical protein VGG64_17055 [Pirellulales bacterium]|jgi:hypothetical protein